MFMKWQAWLNRTVLGAGMASFFGDLGYESVMVLLPSFLIILRCAGLCPRHYRGPERRRIEFCQALLGIFC